MSELHWGLAGLSVIVVGGVYAYNSWQEYRHRKVAESVLRPEHDDVLLKVQPVRPPVDEAAVERLEPVFAEEGPDLLGAKEPDLELLEESPVYVEPAVQPEVEVAPQVAAEPEQAEPVAAAADAPEPVVAPAAKVEPAAVKEEIAVPDVPVELLDPRIEYIVAMEMIEAVPVRQILASQRETLLKVNKPVHWIGFNETTREWVPLRGEEELSVRRLRIGLQLVNRLGPLASADLVGFTAAMQALADDLTAVADMPAEPVLDQAAAIDRFCADVDLEIGLNLVSRGIAFPGTKIRALAEAAGMVLGVGGMFTRYDDDGQPQFSLQNYENTPLTADGLRNLSTHGLTFLLDVPCVDHGERVFQQMTELAKRFADTLQGALVDDNRQPLGEAQLEHIRREFIGKPQAVMRQYGIAAGSAQSRRLFS
ncbi:cell division protein ZipA C-terminal FtsZ-binding domain-containing protein [Azonexus hydrophilus]|uniref:cell division protein ZipA C-terminal FtsZ-binding domain-containing protein n=1 Tax=Azonexus hydrophilus TaxID=418702 RepID=UPI0019655A01|nr:cell division protein ZipA C-terminal FtsZ-binding domain-containing protein [Azonexus hydrophilus]